MKKKLEKILILGMALMLVLSTITLYEPQKVSGAATDKPEKTTIKTYSSGVGTGTGYMDITWKAMSGATNYKLLISNGYNYEIFTTGNVTAWTTKGKKIFPTQTEINQGKYAFHTDGKGVEFASDPRALYENGYKAGSTFGLRNQQKYIVRVMAVYSSGDGPTSDITDAYMPPETLPAKPDKSIISAYSSGVGTGTGYMDISWKPVSGAIDYKVVISNGYNYEYFTTGNNTSWSTKGKKIFPTSAEISQGKYAFHSDGKGAEFASDPRDLYEVGYKAGSTFGLRNQKKYIVRVLAVYPWGDGLTSDITEVYMPKEKMAKPVVTTHELESDNSKGYLNISWRPSPDALSYKIGLFNGFDYQYINVGNVTSWSTKGRKIWATEEELDAGQYRLHVNGDGSELPIDPMRTYSVAYQVNPSVNYSDRLFYYTRVIAVYEDGESPVSDATTQTMPIPDIGDTDTDEAVINENSGYIDLYWAPVDNASEYKVWISDGKNFKEYSAGDQNFWSSNDQKIWPTNEELERGLGQLHDDGNGTDLALKPSQLYKLNNTAYKDYDGYVTRVTAYDEKGHIIGHHQFLDINIQTILEPADELPEPEILEIIENAPLDEEVMLPSKDNGLLKSASGGYITSKTTSSKRLKKVGFLNYHPDFSKSYNSAGYNFAPSIRRSASVSLSLGYGMISFTIDGNKNGGSTYSKSANEKKKSRPAIKGEVWKTYYTLRYYSGGGNLYRTEYKTYNSTKKEEVYITYP
ncbi:hypothetical protein HBP99_03630 [Listeria booriae]|uniref:hypothetical protein n=1 Tax=Listeria booriae TaxID=1552123 RepID=UPI0016249497|nr:hypothetical protein [Listeria booriae]MBC2367708.1 hypothetical protein [Listeria booriae]